MAEMFLEKFRSLVPLYLEDEWQVEDGLTESELDDALSGVPSPIPLVLREFYLALGGCEDLMEAYHYFFDPDELEIEDGYLLFLEDSGSATSVSRTRSCTAARTPAASGSPKKAPSANTSWTCSAGSLTNFPPS